jgi:hypothetical protein
MVENVDWRGSSGRGSIHSPGAGKNGRIDDAIARFTEEFSFKDHGIGPEFRNKERLAEFFQKARELYSESWVWIWSPKR